MQHRVEPQRIPYVQVEQPRDSVSWRRFKKKIKIIKLISNLGKLKWILIVMLTQYRNEEKKKLNSSQFIYIQYTFL